MMSWLSLRNGKRSTLDQLHPLGFGHFRERRIKRNEVAAQRPHYGMRPGYARSLLILAGNIQRRLHRRQLLFQPAFFCFQKRLI